MQHDINQIILTNMNIKLYCCTLFYYVAKIIKSSTYIENIMYT